MNACLHSPKTVETCIHNPKSGKINIGHRGQNIDMVKADIAFAMSESGPINALKSGLDTNMPRGYKSGDESRMKIVEAIRNNRETSRRYLSKSLVISFSDIQRHIKFLKETTAIIIRLGSDRKGLWRVLKQYPDGKNVYYDFHDTNAIISGRETTSVSK